MKGGGKRHSYTNSLHYNRNHWQNHVPFVFAAKSLAVIYILCSLYKLLIGEMPATFRAGVPNPLLGCSLLATEPCESLASAHMCMYVHTRTALFARVSPFAAALMQLSWAFAALPWATGVVCTRMCIHLPRKPSVLSSLPGPPNLKGWWTLIYRTQNILNSLTEVLFYFL